MKQGIELRQTQQQKLKLTPEIRQSLQILQMGRTELVDFLRGEADKNPYIDLKVPDTSLVPDRLNNDMSIAVPPTDSLTEYLISQLSVYSLTKDEERCQMLVLLHLKENGYLDETVQQICDDSGEDPDMINRCVARIRAQDPPGIGAQNLRDCLQLQAIREGGTRGRECAEILMPKNFQYVETHRLEELRTKLGWSLSHLRERLDHIATYQATPGSVIRTEPTAFVIPDLLLSRKGMRLSLDLNERGKIQIVFSEFKLPELDAQQSREVAQFMRRQHHQFLLLKKGLDQRYETLLTLSMILVRIQGPFLLGLATSMKNISERSLARQLGLAPSTVSRAISNKYMQYEGRVFPVGSLIPTLVRRDKGGALMDSISVNIRRFVAKESPERPVTDSQLSVLLQEAGISVARRTVTKYRQLNRIGNAEQRRLRRTDND